MRWMMTVLVVGLFSGVVAAHDGAAPKAAEAPPRLETRKDKVSYAAGMSLANVLRKQSAEVDLDVFVRGLKDARAGGGTLLTEDEVRAVLIEVQNEQRAKTGARREGARQRTEPANHRRAPGRPGQ